MNILIPVMGFHKGGGNRVLSELANHWIQQGHTVKFLSTYISGNPYFPTIAPIEWIDEKGQPVEKNILKKRHFFSALKEQISLYKGLNNEYLKGGKWDIILANHSSTAHPVAYSKLKGLKCYYIQAYEPDFFAEQTSIKNKVIAKVAAHSYKLPLFKIVNSPIYYRYKEIHANDYVPPGLDFKKLYQKPVETVTFGKRVKLGCIGRIEPHKGTSFVLEAFKILVSKNCDCELHIAFGSIPDEYKELQHIFTHIPKSDSELADFYRSCDIFIAPATVQFGAPHYPVMESMAVGTPVITTYYLPSNESNAWMVSPKSANEIALMVLEVINNEEEARRKVINAKQNIINYSWDNVSKKMIKIFSKSL